jgi:integrase/recombinase XerD
MKYTINIDPSQRIRQDGTASIRLRVAMNLKKAYFPTSIHWNASLITPKGLLQGSYTTKDFISAVEKIEAIKNNIIQVIELNSITDPAEILRQLQKPTKSDFILFYRTEMLIRLQSLKIQYSTYRVQQEAINSLTEFKTQIPFSSINIALIEAFKLYLKQKGLSRNTIWTRLKDIRTYMNLAKDQGIAFTYPFGNGFKFPKPQSRISYLSEADFNSLKDCFHTTENIYHIEILRAFLFSCYTGLRISDIKAIKGKNIRGRKLVFEPQKTKLSESKRFTEIEIPLHDFALSLLPRMAKEIPIFHKLPSEQKINLRLKEIAQIIKLEPFTFHDSRHTFATRFLRFGGKLEVLQKLLGHESIKTTMIYVHIESSNSEAQINMLT